MTRTLRKSGLFLADFEFRSDWYVAEGGEALGVRFEEAVRRTLARVAENPTIGRIHRFRNPLLRGLRGLPVVAPFNKTLLFYRIKHDEVEIWRLMHGARNLSRQLLEPNA